MKRREFLKYGSYGLATLAIGTGVAVPGIFRKYVPSAALGDDHVHLVMKEVMAEMVDRSLVSMWAFADQVHGAHIPGTAIFAEEGLTVNLRISNQLEQEHAFAIPGVVETDSIAPGDSIDLSFDAPEGGTYMYLDPLNAPVNRVMGLHGTLIVLPATGNTPFSRPTQAVQQLFDALGYGGTMPEHFPGDPWDPERMRIWFCNTIDPAKNKLVADLPAGATIAPEEFIDGYLPRYFTMTGKTGFFSSHDPEIIPHGNIGMPLLLRMLNAGLAIHSPHIHGNHVYELSSNGRVLDNPFLLDTWTMEPGGVKDLLLPFTPPPDAHPWPPSNIREFPMPFAMHCHTEMSQTAAGGNYPHGLISDWEITSPMIGGPEPSKEEFPLFRGMDPALFK